jgi:hypothetical protein
MSSEKEKFDRVSVKSKVKTGTKKEETSRPTEPYEVLLEFRDDSGARHFIKWFWGRGGLEKFRVDKCLPDSVPKAADHVFGLPEEGIITRDRRRYIHEILILFETKKEATCFKQWWDYLGSSAFNEYVNE